MFLVSVLAIQMLFLNAQIVVSELHYNPESGLAGDSIADGDFFEFIEFKNIGDADVNLSGATFVQGVTFEFPANTIVAPQEFVIVCNNLAVFNFEYPHATAIGQFTSGKLSNGGEEIVVVLGSDTIVAFEYNDVAPWPETADGMGFSLVYANEQGDSNDPANWRASSVVGGTPGYEEEALLIAPIKINEVLANTVCPDVDMIELYNPTDSTVNIGGWYLTDNSGNPAKWRIPTGTTIDANSTFVFEAGVCNGSVLTSTVDQFGSQFSLSSHGDEIYIYSAENNILTGYSHGFSFGESELNTSIGRYVNSQGEEFFVNLETSSFGDPVNVPKIPELVFSEIMYNPAANGVEYVKVTNNTDDTLILNRWDISGIGFEKDTLIDFVLLAGESFYVVEDSIDMDAFIASKEIGSTTTVFTFDGSMSNSGELLEIKKPGEQYIDMDVIPYDTIIPYYVVDMVDYSDNEPWPQTPDGLGEYLIRINPDTFGTDPLNWTASVSAPPIANAGVDDFVYINSTYELDGSESYDINDPNAILSYDWDILSKPEGSNASLSDANIVNPTFVCDIRGEYIFTLVVTHETLQSLPDTVKVIEYDYFVNGSAILEVGVVNEVELFPTVSEGVVNYKSNEIIKTIRIFDLIGELVVEFIINQKSGTFTLPNQSGNYIIEVTGENIDNRYMIVRK